MSPRLPERFAIFARWLKLRLAGKPAYVSPGGMLQFMSTPPYAAAGRRFVRRIEPGQPDWVVHFAGLEHPLYWPAELPLADLWLVAKEQFTPSDWHYYQAPETPLTGADVVVDCGAAEGLFSLAAAPRCRQVYAVEPLPRFNACLQRTFALLPNVTIVPCLLAEREGVGRLTGSGLRAQSASSGEIEVPVETLDHLFHARGIPVSYLKADVEGAELDLLAGGRELIRACAPRIAITTYHRPDHARRIRQFLAEVQPHYRFRVKGISASGAPVMLHAWVPLEASRP